MRPFSCCYLSRSLFLFFGHPYFISIYLYARIPRDYGTAVDPLRYLTERGAALGACSFFLGLP